MINFNQDQDQQFVELLNKAFKNAQTFNQHKNQSKMKQRKQYQTYIGEDFIIEYTVLITDWTGDNETPGAGEMQIIEAYLQDPDRKQKAVELSPAFIESFLESKLLNL